MVWSSPQAASGTTKGREDDGDEARTEVRKEVMATAVMVVATRRRRRRGVVESRWARIKIAFLHRRGKGPMGDGRIMDKAAHYDGGNAGVGVGDGGGGSDDGAVRRRRGWGGGACRGGRGEAIPAYARVMAASPCLVMCSCAPCARRRGARASLPRSYLAQATDCRTFSWIGTCRFGCGTLSQSLCLCARGPEKASSCICAVC